MTEFKWEDVDIAKDCHHLPESYDRHEPAIRRAKVPGGWFITSRSYGSHTPIGFFYPDPKHEWDGGTLD